MTPSHPLRCETCTHYEEHICLHQHNRMSNIELTLIEMVGCASHSAASRPAPSSCIWIEDEDGNWHTDCGQIHQFTNGTPKENHYGYCPYCGKSLRTVGGDE